VKLFLFNVAAFVIFIWCIKIHSYLDHNDSVLDSKAGGFIAFLYLFVLWPVTLASGGYVIALFLGFTGNRYG
jgi:hypothetical protein